MNLGIVGIGYVGSAVKEIMSNYYHIETYDNKQKSTCESISDLVN